MTIEEAIKDLEEAGIMLGVGDYVDVEALKIAVDVMRDYQRIVYENERLKHENKLAFKEDDAIVAWNRRRREPFQCNKKKCKGCEKFGWICDYKKEIHGYFTCILQNKKCADTHVTAELITPKHFSESEIVLYDD